jgi:hypothetical protein
MPFLDVVKSILNLEPPKPTMALITVNSFSPEELPLGFFNVITRSGKKSLGYRGGFVTYDCGTTVVDGAKRITLDKPLEDLPTVKLDYGRSNAAGGFRVVETDSPDDTTGDVNWVGTPPSPGVLLR